MNSPKNICLNCGKNGHLLKNCEEPIISCGIICFTLDPNLNITDKKIENYFYNKFIDIDEYNYQHIDNIKYIPYFYDKIKLLLIRRKNSLNYIEFIRGKYDVNNIEQVKRIFSLMTTEENIQILNQSFDNLWEDLWKETAKSKIYQKEYNLSKAKFEELKKNNFFDLADNLSKFTEAEWGFPKGRRNSFEKNLNCAIREFCEETSLDSNNINILERVNCLEEEFNGTNMVKYKHIYYIGLTQEEIELNIDNDNQLYEIGDIKWLTVPEVLEKIRPYYNNKIKLIHQVYFFIINLITNIINSGKNSIII